MHPPACVCRESDQSSGQAVTPSFLVDSLKYIRRLIAVQTVPLGAAGGPVLATQLLAYKAGVTANFSTRYKHGHDLGRAKPVVCSASRKMPNLLSKTWRFVQCETEEISQRQAILAAFHSNASFLVSFSTLQASIDCWFACIPPIQRNVVMRVKR